MKKILLALALLVAAAAPAAAQPEASPGEIEAAREMLEASRTRETFIRAMELGMAQAGGDELTPAIREVIREFLNEHFRFEEMEPEFVRMYTDLFTEEEIRALTAFYRTPAGQKMADMAPEMAIRSQQIANERLQAAMPQLMEAIMEAMEAEEEPEDSSDSN